MCGLASQGQLLMCQEEYESDRIASLRKGDGARPPVAARVQVENATLKGIKSVHNIVVIVALDTDELTRRRASLSRKMLHGFE